MLKINFNYLENYSSETRSKLERNITIFYKEVKRLFPFLPQAINIELDNKFLIIQSGTGGFALKSDQVIIDFDENYKGDKKQQLLDLKGSVFHEAYHLVQGYVGESEPNSAIDDSIYEGAATVFERDFAHTNPPWGFYKDIENLNQLVTQINKLSKNYDYNKWKFYNPENKIKWTLYRVGTYIVDQAIANGSKNILELAKLEPKEILALSKVI